MSKPNSTLIAIVIDRSGSMESIKHDTIGGFNTFIDAQKSAAGECNVTLTQFDTVYEVVYNNKPIAQVPHLNGATFVPRGMTALLDAAGRTINEIGADLANRDESNRPAKVIFVIITDGQENASREFTSAQVADMIKHQTEKYGWEFTYLGANVDAFAVAKGLNIPMSHAINYAPAAAKKAFFVMNSSVLRSRAGGSMAYSNAERASAMDSSDDD